MLLCRLLRPAFFIDKQDLHSGHALLEGCKRAPTQPLPQRRVGHPGGQHHMVTPHATAQWAMAAGPVPNGSQALASSPIHPGVDELLSQVPIA